MADTGIDAASTEVNDFKRSIDRLAEGEVKLLAAAYLHQKESSSIDWDLVAKEVESKSSDSCRVRFSQIKKKIADRNASGAGGAISKESPTKVKPAKPRKATDSKAKKETNADGSPKKAKRGRPSKKDIAASEATAMTEAVKAEDEEADVLPNDEMNMF